MLKVEFDLLNYYYVCFFLLQFCFSYYFVFVLQVDDEAMELNKQLMSKLLELDDVDAVYTDQKC